MYMPVAQQGQLLTKLVQKLVSKGLMTAPPPPKKNHAKWDQRARGPGQPPQVQVCKQLQQQRLPITRD